MHLTLFARINSLPQLVLSRKINDPRAQAQRGVRVNSAYLGDVSNCILKGHALLSHSLACHLSFARGILLLILLCRTRPPRKDVRIAAWLRSAGPLGGTAKSAWLGWKIGAEGKRALSALWEMKWLQAEVKASFFGKLKAESCSRTKLVQGQIAGRCLHSLDKTANCHWFDGSMLSSKVKKTLGFLLRKPDSKRFSRR